MALELPVVVREPGRLFLVILERLCLVYAAKQTSFFFYQQLAGFRELLCLEPLLEREDLWGGEAESTQMLQMFVINLNFLDGGGGIQTVCK